MNPRSLPWWLSGGTESCHGCTSRYQREAERRCAGCDRGVCECCAIVERDTRETWCRECYAEREG